MSQLDTYRNNVLRKKEDISKLTQDLEKEQAKIDSLQNKIISAKKAIERTKSQSTINSRLRDIERAEKSIVDIRKKCGTIRNKITRKEKELTTAEKNYKNEEARVNKKAMEEEKKRQKEALRQISSMEQAIRENTFVQSQMQAEIEKLKAIPETITVLFLASNPITTSRLGLDEEVRSIQEKIRLSEYRDSIRFESRWAVRASDILQAINETNPTIVHFSGHGAVSGELVLQNPDGTEKLVSQEAITMTNATASDTIRLVVFNACFSQQQAESVVEHIEEAIGMSDSIPDETACVFAAQLYSSIGFGRSLKTSFDQAKAELLLEGISGENIPRVFPRDGIDAKDIVFVSLKD